MSHSISTMAHFKYIKISRIRRYFAFNCITIPSKHYNALEAQEMALEAILRMKG